MIIMSRKRFEEEVERRLMERRQQEEVWRRMDELDKKLYQLKDEIRKLRSRTEPEPSEELTADGICGTANCEG